MTRVAILLALVLLAQSTGNDGSGPSAPSTHGTQVDRHVDAHVPSREGAPAASPPEGFPREQVPPAQGTGALREVPPPSPVQLPRDPLYRDWR